MIAVSIAIPDEAAFQVAILDMRPTNQFPRNWTKLSILCKLASTVDYEQSKYRRLQLVIENIVLDHHLSDVTCQKTVR